MKKLRIIAVVLAGAVCSACAVDGNFTKEADSIADVGLLENALDNPPEFNADGFIYIGIRNPEETVDAFLGVPFAQPPVGALRWQPPQPLDATVGRLTDNQASKSAVEQVRPAQAFAAACMQGPHMLKWYQGVIDSFGGDPQTFPAPQVSEDCLYLNIWRPQLASSLDSVAPLPVLVFIHGGSNKGGWSFEPNYIGAQLAARGIIVITVPYRLGVFGFLAHAELEHSNFALHDQLAALRWVQENIAALGGDPTRITVSGESAGANNIEFLMASPRAAGLFQRVIHQSGGSPQLNRVDWLESAKLGRQLSATVSGSESADNIDKLRSVPAQQILDAVPAVYRDHYFDPVVDGEIVTRPLGESVAGRHIGKVDLLIGTNADEWTIYLDPEETVANWLADNLLKDDALTVHKLLDSEAPYKNESEAKHLDRLITSKNFTCPSLKLAEAVAANGGKAWVYYFSKVRPGELAASMGAYHGAELPYVFNTHDDWLPTDATDLALTEAMMNYWVKFVKTGNPNHAGMADWPRYAKAYDAVQVLDTEIRSESHSSQKLCEILMP